MPRINIAGEITSAPHNDNYTELYDKVGVAEIDILNLKIEDNNLQAQINNNDTDITNINTNYINHINGIADKHSAQSITYSGEVVGQLNVKSSIDSLQLQVNALVVGGIDLDPRVTQALVDSRNVTHTTLKERLDSHETHAMPHSFKDQINKTYIYGLRQVGSQLIFSYEELI